MPPNHEPRNSSGNNNDLWGNWISKSLKAEQQCQPFYSWFFQQIYQIFFRSWSKINMELCEETIPWATWITVRSLQCWGIISRTLQISIYNSRQPEVPGAHCGVTSSEMVQNYSRMNFLAKNRYAWKLPQDSRLDTQKVRNWVKVSIAYNTLNPHHQVVKDLAPITFPDRTKRVSPHQYQKRLMISETIHIKIFFRPGKCSTAIHYGWRCSHHQSCLHKDTNFSFQRNTVCASKRCTQFRPHSTHERRHAWSCLTSGALYPLNLQRGEAKLEDQIWASRKHQTDETAAWKHDIAHSCNTELQPSKIH